MQHPHMYVHNKVCRQPLSIENKFFVSIGCMDGLEGGDKAGCSYCLAESNECFGRVCLRISSRQNQYKLTNRNLLK